MIDKKSFIEYIETCIEIKLKLFLHSEETIKEMIKEGRYNISLNEVKEAIDMYNKNSGIVK